MSIPLDRLYHYIESIAQDVYGDILIYRFSPHGSKKIEDLRLLKGPSEPWVANILPEIYCYDQEPLNYTLYQDQIMLDPAFGDNEVEYQLFVENNAPLLMRNIRNRPGNVYDLCLLLHSEKNSPQVNVYRQMNFIPVYYWSHALIALDWFRYAQNVKFQKKVQTKPFLVYNRAWSGTREYRLKFADLLIEHNLVDSCQTSVGLVDNDVYYNNHKFTNQQWKPKNQLENYFQENYTTSCYSADFDIDDYNSTDFEIVLETLFQDSRIQLTEKILRPIACRQPFILASTLGSLDYLRSYGFKTFDSIIDETYDTVTDHYERLQAIIEVMKTIKNWTPYERESKMQEILTIVDYNQKYFFSKEFFNLITSELKDNLYNGIKILEQENTSQLYIELRKKLLKMPAIHKKLFALDTGQLTRQENIKVLKKARSYYNRYLADKNP